MSSFISNKIYLDKVKDEKSEYIYNMYITKANIPFTEDINHPF